LEGTVADFTFVIPALNEADRIADVIAGFGGFGAEILVVDNGSDDGTAHVARRLGARVIYEPRRGKGYAVVAGARAASSQKVFLCDGDVIGLNGPLVRSILEAATGTELVVRMALARPPESAPVTYLTAGPLMLALGFERVAEPLGGLALVQRDFLINAHIPGGWGFDVAITLAALVGLDSYREIPTSGVTHRRKPLEQYRGMAEEVCAAILHQLGKVEWHHEDCTFCTMPHSSSTLALIDQSLSIQQTETEIRA
jgi:glycosyltransferase involved in cell wall biosynthesis